MATFGVTPTDPSQSPGPAPSPGMIWEPRQKRWMYSSEPSVSQPDATTGALAALKARGQ
jgi:hypothetical protein